MRKAYVAAGTPFFEPSFAVNPKVNVGALVAPIHGTVNDSLMIDCWVDDAFMIRCTSTVPRELRNTEKLPPPHALGVVVSTT